MTASPQVRVFLLLCAAGRFIWAQVMTQVPSSEIESRTQKHKPRPTEMHPAAQGPAETGGGHSPASAHV